MSVNRATVLDNIIAVKKEEVKEGMCQKSLQMLKNHAQNCETTRGFYAALLEQVKKNKAGVIAELKKASPSKGVLCPHFDPHTLAQAYEAGGATCLSVLTDTLFFQGDIRHLQTVRSSCLRPLLRKDFIIHPWQIYESRVLGADCILLIVAALEKQELVDFYGMAREIELDVLVEVHNEDELEQALSLREGIVGINNRDLHTFHTSLEVTYRLLKYISPSRLVVTESGISTQKEVALLFECNVRAFLVGESLMRARDPGAQLATLFDHYL